MNKKVYLFGEVDADSVGKAIIEIHKLEAEEASHVDMYINSGGGDLNDAFALVDVIMNSPLQIDTYGIGKVMSAAFMIYLAGRKRFATHRSKFLFHEPSTYANGPGQYIKEHTDELVKDTTLMNNFVVSRCKIPGPMLDDVIRQRRNWYMTSVEARHYGVVHKIIQVGEE